MNYTTESVVLSLLASERAVPKWDIRSHLKQKFGLSYEDASKTLDQALSKLKSAGLIEEISYDSRFTHGYGAYDLRYRLTPTGVSLIGPVCPTTSRLVNA